MGKRALHAALRDFALETAALLTAELKAGAELPFEVAADEGRGSVLYCYRAHTAEFIAVRWSAVHDLPTYESAAHALAPGAAAYLRLRGVHGDAAEPALQDIVERLYEGSTNFAFPEERFERIYAELERTLCEATATVTVIAPLNGVRIESRRVELDEGLALVPIGALDTPPEPLAGAAEAATGGEGIEPTSLVCALERDLPSEERLPLVEASARFGRVLGALRLAGAGGAGFGSSAWARVSDGAWHPAPLRLAAGGRGDSWKLPGGAESELRELLGVLLRSRQDGTVAWALDRFEMGCGRARETEALSDYLLALRALLGEDRGGTRDLAPRLAALCAGESERRTVQRRMELGFALERVVIQGADDFAETIGARSPCALVGEIEQNLRALLRDVLCGYLSEDLRAAADEILLASAERGEIRAQAPRADVRSEPPARRARRSGRRDRQTEEFDAIRVERLEPADAGEDLDDPARRRSPDPAEAPARAAVTPSEDWGFDEDPDSYSAPV